MEPPGSVDNLRGYRYFVCDLDGSTGDSTRFTAHLREGQRGVMMILEPLTSHILSQYALRTSESVASICSPKYRHMAM